MAQKLTSLDPANATTFVSALQADREALVAQGHDAVSLLCMCSFSAMYDFYLLPSATEEWCDDVDYEFEWAGTLVQALHATAGFPRFFQDATNPDTKLGYDSAWAACSPLHAGGVALCAPLTAVAALTMALPRLGADIDVDQLLRFVTKTPERFAAVRASVQATLDDDRTTPAFTALRTAASWIIEGAGVEDKDTYEELRFGAKEGAGAQHFDLLHGEAIRFKAWAWGARCIVNFGSPRALTCVVVCWCIRTCLQLPCPDAGTGYARQSIAARMARSSACAHPTSAVWNPLTVTVPRCTSASSASKLILAARALASRSVSSGTTAPAKERSVCSSGAGRLVTTPRCSSSGVRRPRRCVSACTRRWAWGSTMCCCSCTATTSP